MSSLNEFFTKNGYVCVNVFKPDEVEKLREIIEKINGTNRNIGYTSKYFMEFPELFIACVHNKIVSTLKEILEPNYQLLPDFTVDVERYGFNIPMGAWHLDCATEKPNRYLSEKNYRFVKCGIYLQNNSKEFGGGIDVMPGFRRFIRTSNTDLDFKIKGRIEMYTRPLFSKTLDIKAGDFVAFDSRLPHRGTQPSKNIKKDKNNKLYYDNQGMKKMVIYYNASRRRYVQPYLKTWYEKSYLQNANNNLDFFNYKYPDSYPNVFLDELEKHQIDIGQYIPE